MSLQGYGNLIPRNSGEKNLTNITQDVVKGWNSKINFSSLELSKLVPFVQLISLYDENDVKEITRISNGNSKWMSVINKMNDITINGTTVGQFRNSVTETAGNSNISQNLLSETSVTFKYIPILKLNSQLNSLNKKGGEAINSFAITRGAAHNYIASMNLTITDINIFKSDLELNNLITLNALFLVVYGWSSPLNTIFINPPNFNNGSKLTLDLDDVHNGFWRSMIFRLYQYDYELDEVGHFVGKAEFMSPNQGISTFTKVANIATTLLKALDDPNEIKSERINTDPTNANASQSVVVNYKLSDVFNKIANIINSTNPSSSNTQNSTQFKNLEFRYPKNDTYNISADNFKLNADAVKKAVNTTTLSVLDLIRNLTDTSVIYEPKGIVLGLTYINNIINVNVLGVNSTKLTEDSTFTVKFGVKGSLCESLQLASKMDPNAMDTYVLPALLSDNVNNTAIANRLLSVLGLVDKNGWVVENTAISNEFLSFIKTDANIQDLSMQDAVNRATNNISLLQRFVSQNSTRYINAVQAALGENDLFSRLMGYYLKQTTITIHGTVGLEPYSIVSLKGAIDNLVGIYNVTQLTEQIEIGTFSTIIEARLITPQLLNNSTTNYPLFNQNNQQNQQATSNTSNPNIPDVNTIPAPVVEPRGPSSF